MSILNRYEGCHGLYKNRVINEIYSSENLSNKAKRLLNGTTCSALIKG
ncbi:MULTISPECIES: hypothetical protein [unclassified Butyrivibrio]|nr:MULTISPECIES: hypothetical protein [unclassified Butyrivibrio]SFD07278.1 hypothetical protein SAMN02910398_03968 [Butyrivibrio sp. YAB3001]